jgi:predicted O-methyltransferase YrrM
MKIRALRKTKEIPHSEITFWDEKALSLLLQNKKSLKILEIGSWLGGGSTQILAKYASELTCVDNWKGNDTYHHNLALKSFSPLQVFQKNTSQLDCSLITIIANSTEAAEILKDNYFDFIFIDADHRYEGIKKDLDVFLPKLAKGGTISGHDCEARLSNNQLGFTERDMTLNAVPSPIKKFIHLHPGVVTAVNEKFGNNLFLFSDDSNGFKIDDGRVCYSSIWAHTPSSIDAI